MNDITSLLEHAGKGDSVAANQLMPLIYDRLQAIARRQLASESQQITLTTTALVHEAYLAMLGDTRLEWSSREHFFSCAAKIMRNILIDGARRRLAHKHGGNSERKDIAEVQISVDDECLELVALEQALVRVEQLHPRLASVIELRFFAGLSVADTAALLQVDPRSIERDWHKARAFIHREMGMLQQG